MPSQMGTTLARVRDGADEELAVSVIVVRSQRWGSAVARSEQVHAAQRAAGEVEQGVGGRGHDEPGPASRYGPVDADLLGEAGAAGRRAAPSR